MTDEKRLVQELVDNAPSRVLTQRIKSKTYRHLWEWVLEQTKDIPDIKTGKEQIYLALNPEQIVTCKYGNRKKYVPSKGLGFCGTTSRCQCFRESNSEHFKTNSHLSTPEFSEKRKQTWIKKYGTDNPSRHIDVKSKRKETIAQRKIEDPDRYKHGHIKVREQGFAQVIERVADYVEPCFEYNEYNGCFRKNKYKWKCVKCENIFYDHVDYGRTPVCKLCYPERISGGEIEIREFLDELDIKYETNVRNLISLELDLYLPEHNIAIEYNGIYWHSTKYKTKDYHVNKHTECRDQGIKLIHIFEDQWISKSNLIKNRIKSMAGKSETFYARKCSVEILNTKISKPFVIEYHIQGWASSSVSIGLKHNGELIAVMTFGTNRYHNSEQGSYELIRYCSKGRVVGGASKLLSHFIKNYNPTEIISYADRCWSDGNLYRKIGFTDVTTDDKNTGYFYVKDLKRHHRSSFTKSKLVEMGHPESLTENQIMDTLGYLKIHDCGNYKFQMILDNKQKT